MSWTGEIPMDMRESPGPLWANTTGHGLIARFSDKYVTCHLPALQRSLTASATSSRCGLWRNGKAILQAPHINPRVQANRLKNQIFVTKVTELKCIWGTISAASISNEVRACR